ncbi:MAG: hypothetical protein AAFU71_16210 [Cyanobacteria bacterium J06632_22]
MKTVFSAPRKLAGLIKFATLGAICTLPVLVSPVHAASLHFEEITEDVGPGFGDGLNRYSWSSASKDEYLYIGTFNLNFDVVQLPGYIEQISNSDQPELAALDAFRRLWSGSPVTPSTGGEIWRTKDGSTWEQVFKADPEDVGFRKMIVYDGAIYAGTANGPNGPAPGDGAYSALPPFNPTNTVDYTGSGTALYSSSTGESGTWQEVPGGPSSNPLNASNRAMAVIDGKLWIGTENPISGPELWSYSTADGWTLEYQLPSGVLAIGEIEEYNGEIYFGTWASGDGFELYQYDPDTQVATDVTPNVDADVIEGNQGVMQLYSFNGNFFLGTVNYGEGFTLLKTADPSDPNSTWDVVTTDGFGSEFAGGTPDNAYAWSTQIVNDVLYLGTFNTGAEAGVLGPDIPLDGRGQLWHSTDGHTWEILEDNGFDVPFSYGFRTMTTWNDQLVVGSASNLFFPDLLSSPYPEYLEALAPDELEELIAYLKREGVLDLKPEDYIGTRVYVGKSKAVPEPTSAAVSLATLAALGLLRKRQTAES